jgi:SagB-type dehydrogenase family enzyme
VPPTPALQYHESTKHHFQRFARSAGFLDWKTQPNPFRRYAGAPVLELPRAAIDRRLPYRALYQPPRAPADVTVAAIAELLRCSLGLSAWKSIRGSRWALRVNPSSGNLHPTEGYVVWDAGIFHYAPEAHALERRGSIDPLAWEGWSGGAVLVGLTSIHWREAWKYGERAYRYCQHDLGHGIAALRFAAALLGWRMTLLPRWSDAQLSALLGIDRAADAAGAEREAPGCLAVVTPGDAAEIRGRDPAALLRAIVPDGWRGTANRLSSDHVEWSAIDDVARAAVYPGAPDGEDQARSRFRDAPESNAADVPQAPAARDIILQRRSAVAFDPRVGLRLDTFLQMLRRLRPDGPPWDAVGWPSAVHLILFVHRVEGLTPGIYAFLRDPAAEPELRAAMRAEFLWEPAPVPESAGTPVQELRLLVPTDVTWVANRLSCDQDIAGEGFFSLGMLARFEATLAEHGDWAYRRLFWECGVIGQVLYLEAEAAGVRGTGIGCFYDDPVHDTLGLSGHAWQSLYHFCVGEPVEDTRLETAPGYEWERST